MSTAVNALKPAVSGDTVDVRTIKLGGVSGIAAASSMTMYVWRPGVDRVELTPIDAAGADDDEVEVDLGPFLTTGPAAGSWFVEIDVDGTTWPGANTPAKLTVRAEAPTPAP